MSAAKTMGRFGLALAVALLGASFYVASAHAAFGITKFDGETSANQAGDPFTQAGGHPYAASTTIAFNQTTDSKGLPVPDEPVRQVMVELPPGFIGNPLATPTRCTEAELSGGKEISIGVCPDSSQVGITTLDLGDFGVFTVPVYNMVPTPNEPAQLGIRFVTTDVHIDTRVSAVDGIYKVVGELNNISNTLPLLSSTLTLWGVPADPSHDAQRGECTNPSGPGGLCPANAPLKPFVTMPTACTPAGTGLETSLQAEAWPVIPGTPGNTDEASFFSHLPPGLPTPGPQQGPTGCDNEPFDPSISLQPTSHAADSPTGLHVDLSIPQAGLEVPGGIASSHLKDAIVELPKGMSVNPSSADGLGACTSAQIGLGSDGDAQCPDSSKIGSLEIETPLLSDPVTGSVYVAAQKDNPFGSLLAIYIVAKGPGFVIKLPGHVEAKPDGQLVTSFDDNPQVPFSAMHLDFFGGARAALRTPPTCGTYTTNVKLTPWSGTAPVDLTSSFEVTSGPNGSPCPSSKFAPKLSAGTANPVAGLYSPFALRLTREDAEQELRGVSVSLPPGLVGKLAGIPYCPDSALASIPSAEGSGAAQLASPSCPPASLVGTVSAGAGAGIAPFYVNTGRVYLAGPYKSAPLSLAVVTPAIAGPFDLGNVVVRTALKVDPSTAQIEAVSDPIPNILDGIPLDIRDVRVAVSRPDFTLNPTSCNPMAFGGLASSALGATAPLSERFQVGSCASLDFAPKLSLRLLGGARRSDHPRLRAVLRAKGGDANIARTVVALPHSEFLDQGHIRTVCTRPQFAADQCPAGSVYGHARAISPLLDQPLEGPVYLRSSSNPLPDLVIALHGQVDIDLDGRIDSVRGGIRTTFDAVPDAPVSKFVLTMEGGKKGLLVNSRNLCEAPSFAVVKLDGQNGKTADQRPRMNNSCGRKAKKARHRGRAGATR
jgi:hypothetical protein